MAFTIILTVFIAASANAAFVWQDGNDFSRRPEFKFHHLNFPSFPTFHPFPPLNFPAFPPFPTIPPIKIPTAEDISKNKGPNYNGISVSSSSSSTVDKDGKVIQTGGTTVVTNNNGVVKEFVYGDNPPNNKPQTSVILTQAPIIPTPTMFVGDIKNIKPNGNGNFFGTSSSTFIQTKNVNGEKSTVGGTSLVSNVNGDVQQRVIQFDENKA